VLLVFGAPCQLKTLARQEHGRTIPLAGIVAQAGGRSQLVSLFAAAIVLALIAFGAALLTHVPKAALAGVLLFIAQRIFRMRVFADIFKQSIAEFSLALATLAAIVIFPIQTGVAIGIFLSLLHGIFTVTRARPIVFERVTGTTIWWPPARRQPRSRPIVPRQLLPPPISWFVSVDVRRQDNNRR
jgi:SulP family sulfate permease